MRVCLVGIVVLLFPAHVRATADQKKQGNNHITLEQDGKKVSAEKAKQRKFRVEIKFEVEQITEMMMSFEGAEVPGLVVRDGKLIDCGGDRDSTNDDQTKEQSDRIFRARVEGLDKNTVRLTVWTEELRTDSLPDGFSGSLKIRFQAVKTVKLGEKFKLDLAGDSLPGIKATCEGVINEKMKHSGP
jgi:hypothetical protein